MPNPTMGSAGGSPNSMPSGIASLNKPLTPRAKGITVHAASNGFVVSTDKKDEYGQTMSVAKDVDEVISIISAYLKEE
jgi:hypothetical protein